jgi:tetratricopeptide (TPR) repeat protein
MKRSDHEKALTYLRQAVQLREDIRIAYMDLGIILAEAKQYAEAIDALQRAAQLDPAQPDAHYRLGRVYQNMGNKSAAQQELNKVQELHKAADEDMASQMARAAGRNSSQ